MCKVIVKICFSVLLVAFVEAGFFDLTDVDDPLAMLWNVRPENKYDVCKGACIDKAKCLLTGGTPTGHCGLFFTCCSYEESCMKSSDKKQSVFEVKDLNPETQICKHTIKLRNKNVCQVRLDFETFVLAPTTLRQLQDGNYIYVCDTDLLRITPHHYGVPHLCGYNSKQHLYIHVNQSTDPDRYINLDFKLEPRLKNSELKNPSWRIKFTQLECPLKRNKFDIMKYTDIDSVARDFNMLAPQGAIQYFTDTTGEIRSFGFESPIAPSEDKQVSYPYLEHYTMAFRKPHDMCGIKFTTQTLNLLSESGTCDHYLFVPEYSASGFPVLDGSSKVCQENPEFYSYPPGPLYINFNSLKRDQTTPPSKDNLGFHLNYEMVKSCSGN